MLSAVSRGFREAKSVSGFRLSYCRRCRVIRLGSAHASGKLISGVARLSWQEVMRLWGYKWYVKQRLWQQKKTKTIPEQYRKYTLIEFGPQGDYYKYIY